uniref:Uncharacterized protein n=2 Tax=gambiae species complex TaxID=44542 RepID=A0A182IHW3_ANOAR
MIIKKGKCHYSSYSY